MIPKKQMEDKQLNFNQPLLSVRRGSSTKAPSEVINRRKTNNCSPNLPPLPFYKSELKSGPVRNPGVVPFQWEQTPGNPKNESKKEQRETPEKLPLAPRLPPGRVTIHNKQTTNKVLKDSPGSSSRSHASSPEFSSVDKVLSELVAEELEKEKEMEKENENVSSSEDENVTYVDAQDTLSRSESFFLNCSLSGVSGLDGANVKPSFSDPQIRDFMMDRFLPAAKAVASETPQFASKKAPVAREEPRSIEPLNMGVKSKGSPICYDVHNISLRNIYGEGDQDDDEEDEEEDAYEGPEELSAKFCGLLPKFCLLNPIPGLRDHAQIIPQVRSARTKPAYRGASIKNENMDRTGNHRGEVKNTIGRNGYPNKSSSNGDFGRKCIAQSKEGSPQSFLGRERGKTDIQNKGFTRFKELLEEHYATEGKTSPSNPITERTLYIDSEQRASESRNSNSSSSESRGRTPSVDYSLQDVHSHFAADEKATFQHKSSEMASSQRDQDLSLVVALPKERTEKSNPLLELAPPLPKSPSESWLSRTLPTISSKNPTSKTFLGNPGFKQSPSYPKHGRMPFHPRAELAPILEN